MRASGVGASAVYVSAGVRPLAVEVRHRSGRDPRIAVEPAERRNGGTALSCARQSCEAVPGSRRRPEPATCSCPNAMKGPQPDNRATDSRLGLDGSRLGVSLRQVSSTVIFHGGAACKGHFVHVNAGRVPDRHGHFSAGQD
jgi:hypothetical protein